MKRINLKTLITASLLFVAVLAKAQTKAADEIIRLMDKATTDWNKGDLPAYMALYDASATMMMPTGRAGLADIENLYVKYYFVDKMPKQELSYNNYQVTMLGNDYALLTGVFVLKANDKLKERKGSFSLIFVHRPEGWKILHDHSG